MNKPTSFIICIMTSLALQAQSFDVQVENTLKHQRYDVPIVINISQYKAKSAVVICEEKEIPSQMDDLNQDGIFDELCFLTDFDKKGTKNFSVTLFSTGTPREYMPRVYVEMLLNHPKQKNQRQTNYISSLTTAGNADVYNCLQHHGPAFENELVAYRIYFDKRQTVDIYGKYRKGLELKQTQFYPTKEELADGFGDDCLWVGSTLGVGTLRGWDGDKPTFLDKVKYRTERILAYGPLRTIVEVIDEGWQTSNAGKMPVDMKTRYTLYAGHRDVKVDITFNENINAYVNNDYMFCTGIINVKNSTEYTNNKGLRGCWGTDWPVSAKDSVGHKRETVGLGISVPQKYFNKELKKNKDNYPILVSPNNNELHYSICFASNNESFGYHRDTDFYSFLKKWNNELENPVRVIIKPKK